MKRGSTLFLRAAVAMIGLAVLALCIFVLPLGIGSDVTGYYRPILIGLYIPAIPFYFALYQSITLLNLIDKDTAFSDNSVIALKNIKHCGLAISALFAAGMPYLYYAANQDDAPGVMLGGLVIMGASLVVATFAGLLQRLLKSAIDIKSENDLTV